MILVEQDVENYVWNLGAQVATLFGLGQTVNALAVEKAFFNYREQFEGDYRLQINIFYYSALRVADINFGSPLKVIQMLTGRALYGKRSSLAPL